MCEKNTSDILFAPQHIKNFTYRVVVTRLPLTISRVGRLLKTLFQCSMIIKASSSNTKQFRKPNLRGKEEKNFIM